MNLHTEKMGAGPDLVLLHGWGLHGGVFTGIAQQLAQRYRVTIIDLPGHGRSPAHGPFELIPVAERVAAAAPQQAAWLGWSLGGMIATEIALIAPEQVNQLILASSSPRFVTARDWPYTMDPAVLKGFAEALQDDYRATLERFLALQVVSGAEGRETLRRLRDLLLQFTMPSTRTLNDGLALLRSADLRAALAGLACPVLMILGKQDRLVPAGVGPAVQKLLPAMRTEIIPGAGHAPFLSHPQEFIATVTSFLDGNHD